MTQKMKAVRVHGPNDVRLETIDIPQIGKEEILVRAKKVGVGISDPIILRGNYPGPVKVPVIAGHEFIGEVVDLGPGAGEKYGLKIGDLAVPEQIVPCWTCYYCKRGNYNLCEVYDKFGASYDGGWSEYIRYPSRAIIYKVPSSFPLKAGVAIESTACAVYTVERGNVRFEDTIVILGGGFLGFLILQVAKLKHPKYLIYCDNQTYRLELAKKLGADLVIDIERDDVLSMVLEVTNGLGCDVVFDNIKSSSIELGSKLLRKRGRFVVGAAYSDSSAPKIAYDAICNLKELQFIGRTMSGGMEIRAFPTAIEFLNDTRVRVEEVVTHDFPLIDYKKAYEIAEKKSDKAIKVSLTP